MTFDRARIASAVGAAMKVGVGVNSTDARLRYSPQTFTTLYEFCPLRDAVE